MAVTVTPNAGLSGAYTKVWDITATADGDTTTGDIAHGLGEVPASVVITPLLAEARLSQWILTMLDDTNVVLTKTTEAGSGTATTQVRLIVSLPHSVTR